MKVLEVIDSFFPNVDGPNLVVVSVADSFKRNGYGDMQLLVPQYKQKIEFGGLEIHRCFSLPSNEDYRASMPFLDAKVKKLIKKGGFDLIHIHSPFLLGKYARKKAEKYGIPVVFTMHTKFRDEFERRLKLKVLQKFMMRYIMGCINKCTCVTTVSEGAVETLREYGYKDWRNVRVIRNATNMPKDYGGDDEASAIREKYSPDGEFLFLFVGRLAETKNIQFSLRVLAEVKKENPHFKYLVVGDGDYGKTLKKLTASLGLNENVVFVGKVSDKKQLASYYKACDLMLFPSFFDTAGIVVLEASANRTATVTFEGSCACEPLEEGESGFIWANDEKIWAENILNILKNPEIAHKAGEGAYEKVYVDWDEITARYYDLYRTLVKKG